MPETENFKPKTDAVHDKTPRICTVCGKECVGAGGLGAHMTTHYRKGEAEPPTGAKQRCPHCGAMVSKAYLRGHIENKHADLLRRNQTGFQNVRPAGPGKLRVQIEQLSAREVCRVVLEQALTDGKINLDALDAYEQWVQDTEKFLTVLYR